MYTGGVFRGEPYNWTLQFRVMKLVKLVKISKLSRLPHISKMQGWLEKRLFSPVPSLLWLERSVLV